MKKEEYGANWKPAMPLRSGRRRRKLLGVYSQAEFGELIHYERARSDRTGEELSLVIFGSFSGRARRNILPLINGLQRNVRTTDHIGWYGDTQIGVLLPMTGYEGARTFVTNCQNTGWASGLMVAIHTYPDRWVANGKVADSESAATHTVFDQFTRRVPTWKRSLDIIGSVLGLIALMPFFILISFYIKVVSPGPIFFRQKRVGLARKQFDFIKFRTMHHNNSVTRHSHHLRDLINYDKPMIKLDAKDPRIIPGGRVLRKLAVDELPQLLNVLKGEMTLVGPRPCIPYEADEYMQWHSHRFAILPGLTGLWQVSGKNNLTFQQMIRLDIKYERNMSLWWDLWIIFRTIPALITYAIQSVRRRAGAHAADAPAETPAMARRQGLAAEAQSGT